MIANLCSDTSINVLKPFSHLHTQIYEGSEGPTFKNTENPIEVPTYGENSLNNSIQFFSTLSYESYLRALYM